MWPHSLLTWIAMPQVHVLLFLYYNKSEHAMPENVGDLKRKLISSIEYETVGNVLVSIGKALLKKNISFGSFSENHFASSYNIILWKYEKWLTLLVLSQLKNSTN